MVPGCDRDVESSVFASDEIHAWKLVGWHARMVFEGLLDGFERLLDLFRGVLSTASKTRFPADITAPL
jgi:hypothetical protein